MRTRLMAALVPVMLVAASGCNVPWRDEDPEPPPPAEPAPPAEAPSGGNADEGRKDDAGEGPSGTSLRYESRPWSLDDDAPVEDRPRAVGPPAFGSEAQPSLAPLVEHLTPTVVGVTTYMTGRRPGRMPGLPPGIPPPPDTGREQMGIGSGVIIDPAGLVLTNHHVIARAERVEVRLADDREFTAEVVGTDPETDIAVLRLQGVEEPLPAAPLGRSDALRVGDYVIAIGNPFGLALTVTAGIISATARVIGAGPFDDFLQTDAAINPGNSGGPLFDLEGRVVGINTAIVAPGEGIGFAVPIDLVRALLPQLVDEGRVVRGYLGVVIQNLTPQIAGDLDLPVERGAMVVRVERGGPADRAGLRDGDVIVAAGEDPVDSAAGLSRHVAALPPGETVRLTVLRDGRRQRVEVTLGERPARPDLPGLPR
jgi:serine protease Do